MKGRFLFLAVLGILFICQFPVCPGIEASDLRKNIKIPSHARIPKDMPLNAVKWTGGFWKDRMRRLRDIYLPGVLDGSFMTVENGATFRNLLRAAGLEQGGALGRTWSDGDCYLVLDTVSRLYAYCPDDYLKTRLDYWIPIIGRIQRSDGLVDSWTVLKRFDSKDGKQWERFYARPRERQSEFQGSVLYNMGSLHAAATTHQQATSEDHFLTIADKAVLLWVSSGRAAADLMHWAIAPLYSRTGDPGYLDALRRAYPETQSAFGPPLRVAPEIFGHNAATAHDLMGATALCGFTGEQDLRNALVRLATNMLAKKTYITGAVAPVFRNQRPAQTIKGKTYPAMDIVEAVGKAYDLPNDSAYCESCGQALYMEWYYRMFRLTGKAVYMDAAERALYNTVPGCVDLDRPNFFYCNPQEQLPGSKRSHTSGTADGGMQSNYTWRRQYTKKCACCPPKVMRAIAMSVEMAYNVNSEGLWVSLYGDNTANVVLPDGGASECRQISKYPWDGKVQLILDKVESEKPFSIFLRIPGWVDGSVRITLNGDVTEVRSTSGTYYRFHRHWKSGDTVEMELPMTVRFMAAHPNVVDDWGKVAVMRGPVVYCLEGCDIPEGTTLETIYVPSNVALKPQFTEDLGGIIKLTGELVHSTTTTISVNKLVDDAMENTLHREVRFEEGAKEPTGKDRYVTVSMIPYYTRLNRESDFFRIWLPVCGRKKVISMLIAERAQIDVRDSFPSGTLLHYAVERGNMEMAEMLIASGADVNAKNVGGDTSLHSAVRTSHKDFAELLITSGADINTKNKDGEAPVDVALGEDNRSILQLLIAKGSNLDSIHLSAYQGDLDEVRHYIDKGTDVNMPDSYGATPLHYAARRGHKKVVEFLVARGTDVNAKDKNNNTPLHSAAGGGHKDVVALLIDNGAEMNARGRRDYTPIYSAAWSGVTEVVELLLEKGADVNVKDEWGWTPLHYMAQHDYYRDMAELLIAKGADVNAEDKWGETPLQVAQRKGHTDIFEVLRKYSNDTNLDKPYVVLERGDVRAVIVNNEPVDDEVLPGHRGGYSGVASLTHQARDKNIFVPFYAGLNFEHIHDGTVKPRDILFEPRRAPMQIKQIDEYTAELYQLPTPHWQLESWLRYKLLEDGVIEMTLECIPRARTFKNDYIGLFFASYIDKPESLDIHFLGRPADDSNTEPRWIRGMTPVHGTLPTHLAVEDNRIFAHDPNFPLTLVFNKSNYRYTEPWYYGVSHGMALVLIFRPEDNVRLSQSPSGGGDGNPAWDFQWFVPQYKVGQRYCFVMRAMYLPFESRQQIIRATARHRAALER